MHDLSAFTGDRACMPQRLLVRTVLGKAGIPADFAHSFPRKTTLTYQEQKRNKEKTAFILSGSKKWVKFKTAYNNKVLLINSIKV
jgi:hypothetical protein